MALFKVTPEGAVKFVKRYSYFAFSWPLPTSASKFEMKIYNLLWALSTLNCICLILALLYNIYEHLYNALEVVTSLCFTSMYSCHVIGSTMCRLRKNQFQKLINEMEFFLKIAQPYERQVLESYTKKCSGFYFPVIIDICISLLIAIIGPLWIIDRKFPYPSTYPFSVDPGFIKCFIYLHQSLAAIACCSIGGVNCQVALLVWFATARIEIHSTEFKTIRNSTELRLFVKKHQHLLRFAKEAASEMSYIALLVIITGCVTSIASSITVIYNFSLVDRMRFLCVTLSSGIILFFCAWPADSLIEACNILGDAAYNSPWVDMSSEMRRNIVIIIRKTQQPVVVSIGGIMTILSLRYFGRFVSAVISYFMALRVIVSVKEP